AAGRIEARAKRPRSTLESAAVTAGEFERASKVGARLVSEPRQSLDLGDGKMNGMKRLAAAVLMGLTLTTSAYGAAAIKIFQDAANNIPQDAFAWGSTLHDTVTGASNNTCYRVQFFDPTNTLVATHDLPGPGGSGRADRFDSFVVPSGPSGTWTAKE